MSSSSAKLPTNSVTKSTGLHTGTIRPGVAKVDPIVTIDNVSRKFGGLVAVDVEHLEIPRGAITALIGPNGAGKTTLFNLLTGFDKPDTGTWNFAGKSLAGIPAFKVAQMGQVRTFQLTKALSLIRRETITKNNFLTTPGVELLVVLAVGFENVSVDNRSFTLQLKEWW